MMNTSKVKLISGWSKPGGSTVAHINLINLLNENGVDATFYGPHDYHLGKCKSGYIQEAQPIEEDDILIMHFFNINARPLVKQLILSCHETNLFPLSEIKLNPYDVIHYVSNSQRNWHSVNHPSVVIPNVVSNLKKSPLNTKAAGVIGSIDPHKQPHVAVKKALKDGWEKVLLFGETTDKEYAKEHIVPLLEDPRVTIMGYFEDKQAMYDMIDKVYHFSKRETFNYIKAECEKTGVEYRGNKAAESGAEYLSDKEVLDQWMRLLKV